ncbi:MAG: GNAT family N-acetyltransferase [Anaerolineaceae bacterium]|nr:GNAT family N-acetyltransferase [Anaerolineaceae bacterium]
MKRVDAAAAGCVMNPISHRPYQGEADLFAMKRILSELLSAGLGSYHRGDLDWWLIPEIGGAIGEQTELWFRGEELLAFVIYMEERADYDVIAAPAWRGSALERDLMLWADAHLSAAARRHQQKKVCAYCSADHPFQRDILSELGYEEGQDVILYAQDLPEQALPAVPLPVGFRWLPPMRLEWVAARAAAHADAFHPSKMTPAAYRRLLRSAPDYDEALDVVAVAPDGQHAAFALAWVDEAIGIGLFEPVGTRRAYQRRGLGHAVLREGLRRLQARGMRRVMVGCEADNEGNQAFYEGAGFREQTRILAYRRKLT